MKQFEIKFHMINDEVLTQVVEEDSRYAALEQSINHFVT